MLVLATLNESQRQNHDDEGNEGSPRAKRTLCSRNRRDKDVCLRTARSWMQTDPVRRSREQDRTRRSSFQPTFACSYSPAYQTPPERAQKQKPDPTERKVSSRPNLPRRVLKICLNPFPRERHVLLAVSRLGTTWIRLRIHQAQLKASYGIDTTTASGGNKARTAVESMTPTCCFRTFFLVSKRFSLSRGHRTWFPGFSRMAFL